MVGTLGCNSVLGINPPVAMDGGDAASSADANGVNDAADSSMACMLPSMGDCNVLPQSGCGADQNCEVTGATGVTSCTPSTNTPIYANCNGSTGQCPKGSECIGLACKPFCCDVNDCAGGLRTCEQIKNGSLDIPGLRVCSAGCDLLDPSTKCGPGVACYPQPWDGKGKDHGDCFGGAGTGVGPGACTQNTKNDCAPGYYCLQTGECAKWCRLAVKTDCPNGTTCTVFNALTMIGGTQYGTCQ